MVSVVVGLILSSQAKVLVYECDPQPVGKVVREIAVQENLAISADPEFDHLWIAIRSKSLDRDKFLTVLAEHAQASWVREDESLVLRRTNESRSAHAAKAMSILIPALNFSRGRASVDRFLALTDDEIRELVGVSQESPPELIQRAMTLRLSGGTNVGLELLERTDLTSLFLRYGEEIRFSTSPEHGERPFPPAILERISAVAVVNNRAKLLAENVPSPNMLSPFFPYSETTHSRLTATLGLNGFAVRSQLAGSSGNTSFYTPARATPKLEERLALANDNAMELTPDEKTLLTVRESQPFREAATRWIESEDFEVYSLGWRHLPQALDTCEIANYMIVLDPSLNLFSNIAKRWSRMGSQRSLLNILFQRGPRQVVYDDQLNLLSSYPLIPLTEFVGEPSLEAIRALWQAASDLDGLQVIESNQFFWKCPHAPSQEWLSAVQFDFSRQGGEGGEVGLLNGYLARNTPVMQSIVLREQVREIPDNLRSIAVNLFMSVAPAEVRREAASFSSARGVNIRQVLGIEYSKSVTPIAFDFRPNQLQGLTIERLTAFHSGRPYPATMRFHRALQVEETLHFTFGQHRVEAKGNTISILRDDPKEYTYDEIVEYLTSARNESERLE